MAHIHRAYETSFWPFMGFLFMPWTTVAYAYCINECNGVHGIGVLWIVLAVMADLGTDGSAANENGKAKFNDEERTFSSEEDTQV